MNGTRIPKRVLTILLSLALVFSLLACGGESADSNSTTAVSSASTQAESTQSESTQEVAAGKNGSRAQDDEAASPAVSDETAGSTAEKATDPASEKAASATSKDATDSTSKDAAAPASEDAVNATSEETAGAASEEAGSDTASGDASGSHILIAFFSHTGENHNVGVIEKGNTHIIADMIAEETGADLFEIVTVNPYPDTYDECTDVAKQEQNENARPEIVDPPENLDGYDTIFIGYPIWWGDLPMAVYTFLERYDFAGKTVIPFCTHEGSGLAGTGSRIGETCSGASVLDGLAVRGSVAQNEQEEARASVTEWLDGLDLK